MTSLGNTLVGLAFVTISAALTFLMFYIWKFPFDHEKLKSEAPASLIRLHRILGLVYVLIYLYLMYQMVPRLWAYQIELPARTVVHLSLGILIGVILITKISIVRFFKHMEAKLVPMLGVSLFLCTFLLIALTLPFSLREAYLQNQALGEDDRTEEMIQRVEELLPGIGLDDELLLEQLTTRQGLDAGRKLMQTKCVQCHDLRTVLVRPRTPQSWKQTVARMANRSTVLAPISEEDQWFVTAYLIAVSPTLQESLRQRREAAMEAIDSQQAMVSASAMVEDEGMDGEYDAMQARGLFEQTCSLCHAYTQVDNAPPANQEEAIALVQRMVGNGLSASDQDLNTVIRYLTETYGVAPDPSSLESDEDEYEDEYEDECEDEYEDEYDDECEDEYEDEYEDEEEESQDEGSSATPVDGKLLYSSKGCVACHGVEGRSPIGSQYPILASLGKGYLVRQITDIKSGARNNGLTSLMSPVTQNVSDEEIEAIAQYLSELK